MFEDERDVLCWCPWHDTIVGVARYQRRHYYISTTKDVKQFVARYSSFKPVFWVDSIPDEVRRAAFGYAEKIDYARGMEKKYPNIDHWEFHAILREHMGTLMEQLDKEMPKNYWTGKRLVWTRRAFYVGRVKYRLKCLWKRLWTKVGGVCK